MPRVPTRVVAASGALAENLAAIGAGNSIVAIYVKPNVYGELGPEYQSILSKIKVINTKTNGKTSAEDVLAEKPDFVYSQGQKSGEGGPTPEQFAQG